MTPQPTILVLGAGANVGLSVVQHFHEKGWRVAAVARTTKPELKNVADIVLEADFADVSSIQRVWDETVARLGTPGVVVYNAYSLHPARLSHPLTLSPKDLATDMTVNALSAYEAARLAVGAWVGSVPTLDAGQKTPAFIYTGNMMNTLVLPAAMSLGMGKNAAAYFIESAAHAYKGTVRFYFADERMLNGDSVMADISGLAHADEFWSLVHGVAEKNLPDGRQGEWDWTFVKGMGYKKMDGVVNRSLNAFAFPGLE